MRPVWIAGQAARACAAGLLELVGLSHLADRRTKTYSGEIRRGLDLASALVRSPEVLFVDGPTTGSDPASRLTIRDEVSRIAPARTVFLITQYLEEADQLCDRLAIIDNGRGHAGTAEGRDGA